MRPLRALPALLAKPIMPAFALELSTASQTTPQARDVLFRTPQRHALCQTISVFRLGYAVTHDFVVLTHSILLSYPTAAVRPAQHSVYLSARFSPVAFKAI